MSIDDTLQTVFDNTLQRHNEHQKPDCKLVKNLQKVAQMQKFDPVMRNQISDTGEASCMSYLYFFCFFAINTMSLTDQ
jgi:hypothetical protein